MTHLIKVPDFPIIDPVATGLQIKKLRENANLTVRDLQRYFGFTSPNAIYHWQAGISLPSVDNLYYLSIILGVPMETILVPRTPGLKDR